MKRLVCEMCGGSDLVKQDGVFVCQNCGTKYSVEEARKMMVEGTVSVEGTVAVEGTVKVDKSEELKKLYTLARRAKDSDNTDNAVRYYTQIEMQDPDSWEAYFYLIYFKARTSKIGEIPKNCKNLSNCFPTTFDLLVASASSDEDIDLALTMIIKDVSLVSEIMISSALESRDCFVYRAKVYGMIEVLGDCLLTKFPHLSNYAISAWTEELNIFVSQDGFDDKEKVDEMREEYISLTGYRIDKVAEKIYDLDPSYDDPLGVSKELRGKETFITCPKCGATMRERESKCPQCGTSKEEVQRLIEEKKAQEAAERERLRKEREAKEAEEARIRAERRAEWWQQNGKKVIRAAIISVALLVLIIVGLKTAQAITNKRAISKAEAIIEQADALIATYQFDEARELYRNAYQSTKNKEAQRMLSAKENEIDEAQNKADAEYEDAIKKLKILLDADDYVFNQYSNECLDKMIKIYPKRKETIYYKNLRDKHSDNHGSFAKYEAEQQAEQARMERERAEKEQLNREDRASKESLAEEAELDETLFIVVEKMPEFPGGKEEMEKYLSKNTKNYVKTLNTDIHGTAYCQFVVNRDGSLTDAEIVRSSGNKSLDEEAIRIIKSMPKWNPGKQRGKAVRVKYTLSIRF